MKTIHYCRFFSFFFLLLLFGCNKVKRMPEKVYTQIDVSETSFIMQLSAPGSNHSNSQYINVLDEYYQLTELKEELKSELKKSNIRINDKKSTEYLITIESITLHESYFETRKYTDTCQCPNKEIELPLNTLSYTVEISIFNLNRQVNIHSFTKSLKAREQLRDCACGENAKRIIDVSVLREELAEMIRDEIADIIYVDKGF
ncbi:MAG: hypothetical protein NXI10_11810 [bacterium]|nr:hypothetical protein [bacterium]